MDTTEANLDPVAVAEVNRLADAWARGYANAGYMHLCNAERAREVAMDKGPTVTGPRGGTFAAWTPETAESRLFVKRFLRTFRHMLAEAAE